MGYGKTTGVNWYLAEYAETKPIKIIRISVYCGNLAIFRKSVQDAFVREGFDFLRYYVCPTAAAAYELLARAQIVTFLFRCLG